MWQQLQLERGARTWKRNTSADIKVSKGEGEGDQSAVGETSLQPMKKTQVQYWDRVLLSSSWRLIVAKISTCSPWSTLCQSMWMPKGGCDPTKIAYTGDGLVILVGIHDEAVSSWVTTSCGRDWHWRSSWKAAFCGKDPYQVSLWRTLSHGRDCTLAPRKSEKEGAVLMCNEHHSLPHWGGWVGR